MSCLFESGCYTMYFKCLVCLSLVVTPCVLSVLSVWVWLLHHEFKVSCPFESGCFTMHFKCLVCLSLVVTPCIFKLSCLFESGCYTMHFKCLFCLPNHNISLYINCIFWWAVNVLMSCGSLWPFMPKHLLDAIDTSIWLNIISQSKCASLIWH